MNDKQLTEQSHSDAGLEHAIEMLQMIGNPYRLAILCHIGKEEMSVGQLRELVDLSQSALSQHLAKLRKNALVKTRREQQTIYYSLMSHEVKEIIGLLRKLYCNNASVCN